ncbi:MAG: hypothetical protein SFU57_13235 [Gemmatimonadales bacterium]|nr:hypothetical protein [Gemmatimonadales bacterium]
MTIPVFQETLHSQSSAGNAVLAEMAESPEMVLSQFLLRRWEVTRQRPVVRLCGPTAVALMTPTFVAELTRKEYRSVDSIEVIAICPPRDSSPPWTWSPAFLPDADLVMILQITTGPLSSSIDALVGLQPAGDGRPARSRRERFEWDHQRTVAGLFLRFTDFEPPLPRHYQFPFVPAGQAESPQLVVDEFLTRRLEITGQLPLLQFCGPAANALMTPEYSARLTQGDHPLAADIVVAPECPGPRLDNPGVGTDVDRVAIASISAGQLSATIDAKVIPRTLGGPPYPHGRRERFEWDRQQKNPGIVLTFTDFDPPH